MTGVLERTTLTEPEFAIFRFFNDDTDTVLDIGANYGYSAATIWAAGATSKILSFEPNPWHVVCLEQIKQMRPGIFDFVNIALGSSPGELNFVLPVIEGTGVSGLMSAAIESEMDWAIPENVLLYMVNYLFVASRQIVQGGTPAPAIHRNDLGGRSTRHRSGRPKLRRADRRDLGDQDGCRRV